MKIWTLIWVIPIPQLSKYDYVEFQDFLKHMLYNSEKSKLKCQLLSDLVTLHEILGTLYRVLSDHFFHDLRSDQDHLVKT